MNTSTTTRVLAWCLHLLVIGLLALTVVRAVAGNDPDAGAVATLAVVLASTYAIGPMPPASPGRRARAANALWLTAVGAVWLVLLTQSAEGVWLAFPLYFVQLHLLPRRAGLVAVVLTAVAAVAGFAVHQDSVTPAAVIGPALGAAVAVAVVWGYRTLYRESEQRRILIDELTATRADLAAAQHRAGVLQERERLAREIHDTLAQGLSSIQLLLRAAERALPDRTDTAADLVVQARTAAVDNLAEARRFVAALTPPALENTTLADALDRLCATTSARHGLDARFALTGTYVPLPTAHEVALLRVAQSALANIVSHADATAVKITLSFLDDQVAVDIVDDGIGFDPGAYPLRGRTGTVSGWLRCGHGYSIFGAHSRSNPNLGPACSRRVSSAPHDRGEFVNDEPIRLLLADDHPVVRAGLRAVLDTEPGMTVVAEAATAEDAVARAAEGDIDVVVMDLQFGGGDDRRRGHRGDHRAPRRTADPRRDDVRHRRRHAACDRGRRDWLSPQRRSSRRPRRRNPDGCGRTHDAGADRCRSARHPVAQPGHSADPT